MADIKQITVNGITYTIKDDTARTAAADASDAANAAQTTATQANNTANAANTLANTANTNANAAKTMVTDLASQSLKASYNSGSEALVLEKGIDI